jgi:Do/DeqQ family serine protease
MRKRDRYLSGILLLLIGILLGTLFSIYQKDEVNDRADVEVTEIKHSAQPIFSDEELQQLDGRFLFKEVANRVSPTVVYIESEVPFSKKELPDDDIHRDNNEEDFWGHIFPRRARTVGSGVIISSDGYILTNNHVIDGAVDDGIEVTLNDRRSYSARVVGQDPTTDLAVMKIGAENLPAVTIGNSNNVEVGEWVLAIGNPFRLRSTVTAGIVSALSRDMQIIQDQMRVESFIQTDAAINKGNSGGPLVNTSGELIGINTAIASLSGTYQGYGFAAPSNLAMKVARDIIEYGEVHRALLGVAIRTVNSNIVKELDIEQIRGVLVTNVSSDGAAGEAGLQSSDIILSVDGVAVNKSNELQQKIAVLHPGDTVALEVWRDGEELSKKVELGRLETSSSEE